MSYLRKYNTASTGTDIAIQIRKAASADFAVAADWTPVAGDVKLSKDRGTLANIATLPAYTNGRWVFTFSATELSAKQIEINIVDAATKAVDDESFTVETFGNAGAMYPAIYNAGTAGNPFTATDYTQTGDSFARIGAGGAGLTALGDTRIALLDVAISSRGTSTYAGADTAGTTTLLTRVTATVPTAASVADAVHATPIPGTYAIGTFAWCMGRGFDLLNRLVGRRK